MAKLSTTLNNAGLRPAVSDKINVLTMLAGDSVTIARSRF